MHPVVLPFLALLVTTSAPPQRVDTPGPSTVLLTDSQHTQQLTDTSRTRSGLDTELGQGTPITYRDYTLTSRPDGSACYAAGTSSAPTGFLIDAVAPADLATTGFGIGLCPGQAANAARPTPGQAAWQAWKTLVQLPTPVVAVDVTRAVTGAPITLTSTGPTTLNRRYTVYGYAVTLDITSDQVVDWDEPHPEPARADGTTTTTFTSGPVTHQYIDRGHANIRDRQRWTAHWTAGGETGVIADRLVTRAAIPLDIEEIQAVLTSGTTSYRACTPGYC